MSGHRAAELLLEALAYIAGRKNGSASVGHFSWRGMIRTAARTKQLDRTQTLRKLSTQFKEENKSWQTSK